MAKGYLIARITVTDPDHYPVYAKLAGEAMAKYGGKPVVRGGRYEAMDGEARPRNVIIEFESFERAREYHAHVTHRHRHGVAVHHHQASRGIDHEARPAIVALGDAGDRIRHVEAHTHE